MADDKSDPGEFSIGRGRDKGANADSFEKNGASRPPPGQGETTQAEFDLGGTNQRHSDSGMPERLRRKYYVAEAGAGDEARVYAARVTEKKERVYVTIGVTQGAPAERPKLRTARISQRSARNDASSICSVRKREKPPWAARWAFAATSMPPGAPQTT